MGKLYRILITTLVFLSFNKTLASNFISEPKARINSTSTSVCLNQVATITFSVSNGNNSNAPYTYIYTINGGAPQSIQSPSNNDAVSITIPTGTAGTFIYELTSASDSSSTNIDIDNNHNILNISVNSLPNVDFSFTENQCSGSAVQFNSIVSGNNPYTYSWSFGDGGTSSQQNPTHIYSSLGCSTENFNVTLTIIDNNGCTNTISKLVTIKQQPIAGFKDNNVTYNPFNLSNQFNNCNSAGANANYNVSVAPLSSNSNCITSYNIDWGDGSTQQTFTTPPFTHTYTNLGAFNMVITSISSNGCSISKTYVIKNESNPAGGLVSPGSTTNLCAPTPNLQFSISNWALNSPSTTYTIDYGDNTPLINFLQTDLINSTYYNASNPSLSSNYPIPHIYNITSCPNANITAKLTISNSCGTTESTISPIIILRPPSPDFTNPSVACVNTCVTFTNTSNPAYNENCSVSTLYEWDFGDGTGIYSITSSGIPNPPCHIYTSPGVYTITLTAYGYCGVFTKTGTICIESPLEPQFTLSTNSGCIPLSVSATNITDTTNQCSTPSYTWEITYVSGNCGSSSAYTYTGGTSSTSLNPSFIFTESGNYTIKVTSSNTCGIVSSNVQNIIVKKPPTVEINNISNICQSASNTTINPTANINGCAPTSSTLTYAWSFPGGIPSSSNLANPGPITYGTSGTYTVSLSVTNECGTTVATNKIFTIYPSPTITGNLTVCVGNTTLLQGSATAASSNAWSSSNPSVATVSNTGLVTGVSSGSTTITYTNSNGCQNTATITVNPLPTITGTLNVCIGNSTQLTGSATAATSNAWLSSNTAVATIDSTGLLNGISAGTTTITYTNSNGCQTIATITVNPLPTITGTLNVCIGNSTQLTGSATAASTNAWTSSNTAVATINNSGLVTGISAGTTTITYTNSNGCQTTANITVNELPTITGTLVICTGLTTQLSGSATAASTNAWTSSNTAVATVSNTGLVTGVSAGTTTITYTNSNGCQTTAMVTINALPTITGTLNVCIGNSTQLTGSATAASTNAWTSSNSAVATVDNTGLVTSVSAGTTSITYTNSNGCQTTVTITVNPLPTITGNLIICANTTTQLTGNTTPAITNPWSSSNTAVAIVNGSGLVTGVNPGTTIITFTNSNGCQTTATITVNPLPDISGTLNACVGNTSQLTGSATAATSNAWTSSNSAVATVDNTGLVTGISAGTTTITYTNSNDCQRNITFTVNPLPIISGTLNVCIGNSSQLTGSGTAATTNAWTSSNSTVATINNSGLVTGISAGTTTITYTNSNGCQTTTTVTVNPLPTISGTMVICANTTTQLFGNGTAASTNAWTSSNTAVATVSNTGLVTGLSAGTTTITYTNSNGCQTMATVTVNPLPTITGILTICVGNSTQLTGSASAAASNAWVSSNSAIATVSNTGLITGVSAGTTTITYTNTNDCQITVTITVNDLPIVSNQVATICSDSPSVVSLGVSSSVAAATYNITAINQNGLTASAGNPVVGNGFLANEIADDAWTNTTPLPVDVVYTVVPVSADDCQGNPFTVTLTINPEPVVANQTSTICSDINSGLLLNPSSSIFATSYTISTINSNGLTPYAGNPVTGSGFDNTVIADDAWTNTTSAAVDVIYTIQPVSADGCLGDAFTVTLTINPEPEITNQNATICSNSTIGINLNLSTSVNAISFNILSINSNGLIATAGNPIVGNGFLANEIADDVWSNTTPNAVDVIYTILPLSDGNCEGNVFTVTVTINPEPEVTNQTALICSDETSNIILGNDLDGPFVASYDIISINSNGLTSSSGNPIVGTGFTANEIADDAWTNTTLSTVDVIYTVVPKLANGCQGNPFTITLSINPQINIAVTTTPITCYGANDASITLNVTGGTGPYQAQWDNLATGFYQDNLAAADYTILITDSVGCTKTIVVNIPEAPIFTINPVVVNISCYGANDGSINLNLIGGIAPINLTWSDGSTAGLVRNNLPPGVYTVTIVDSKPCTITRSFTIVEPQPLVLGANLQDALDCNDANSGSINLLVSGGTPPFTYNWSNGTTTEDLNNIPAGNYAVLVTDSRGCTQSAQYSINRPQPLALDVETNTNVNCETREITQIFEAQVSGGVPPIQLSWSSGTVSGSNNEFMTTEQDGLVIITATDAIGCTTTYSLNVAIPVLGDASFEQSSYGYTAYGIYSILDPIQFTNTATGDYVSILWSFGDGTFSNEENPIHTYIQEGDYVVTQTVTYPFGCVYVHTISLIIEKGYIFVLPTAFTPNNDTLNDTYRPVTKGLKNVQLDVYDTWGSLIYSEKGDVLRGWDGTIKGVKAENGNYNCKVTAETFYGTMINASETFVLIR